MAQLYAIKHVITASNQFNETAPGTTPVDTDGYRVYPTDTDGGLFDFSVLLPGVPIQVFGVRGLWSDATTWSVKVGDTDGDITAVSGTTEGFVFYEPDHLILAPNQSIKISTAGGTAARYVIVFFARSPLGLV